MRIKCCAAFLVKAVLGEMPTTFNGRVAAQKLIYLAQKALGFDLGYSFMWFSRGPYSKALAKDLRSCAEGVKCLSDEEIARVKDLVEKLKDTDVPLTKALEIVASYLMLREDVFPKPQDPLKELIERKPFIKPEEIEKVLKAVGI